MKQAGVGQRVRQAMATSPGMNQARLAKSADMTEDAMSRSMNGVRAFSSLELAKIADALQADVHWLITGKPDPLVATVAARHEYNRGTGMHSRPGDEHDDHILGTIELAYRQAHPWRTDPIRALPKTPQAVREALGEGFTTHFETAVERHLRVDVLRIQGLTTDYSLQIGGRSLIVLGAGPNWFRSNWSLAHEIAHLALGHHQQAPQPEKSHEAAANSFAAELLLPEAELRSIDWPRLQEPEFALRLWNWGVSTEALRHRLESLNLPLPSFLVAHPDNSTTRLLNRHIGSLPGFGGTDIFWQFDPIAVRMDESSRRRLPTFLLSALREAVQSHGVNPATLGWLLQVDPDTLRSAEVAPPLPSDLDELEAVLRA